MHSGPTTGSLMSHDETTSLSIELNVEPRDRARSWITGAIGYPSTSEHNSPEAQHLSRIRKRLAKLEDSEAQDVVDFLDELLRDGNLEGNQQRRGLDLLRKTVQSKQTIPQRLKLSDVTCNLDMSECIATGGSSTIFKGQLGGRSVCVKVTLPSKRSEGSSEKSFKAHVGELIVSSHVAHENILPFHGVWEYKDGSLAGVSEWMDEGNLRHYLGKEPGTPRIPLMADIISGLDYLHKMGIIHADLKAANVLYLLETRRALLADFGVSHIGATLATNASQLGSIYWTAPEILAPEEGKDMSPPTPESDVWSFACTCYELLTDLTPFHQAGGNTAISIQHPRLIVAMMLRKVVPPLPDSIVVHDGPRDAVLEPKIRSEVSNSVFTYNTVGSTSRTP
ncbi:Serine/threonine-protein kinase HT1 [Leucoagaricus sp. SymC.cos]|nr:Serine/threonine-protein kinase HT1 [Leucoagaricus sp. SymC.cos]